MMFTVAPDPKIANLLHFRLQADNLVNQWMGVGLGADVPNGMRNGDEWVMYQMDDDLIIDVRFFFVHSKLR